MPGPFLVGKAQCFYWVLSDVQLQLVLLDWMIIFSPTNLSFYLFQGTQSVCTVLFRCPSLVCPMCLKMPAGLKIKL